MKPLTRKKERPCVCSCVFPSHQKKRTQLKSGARRGDSVIFEDESLEAVNARQLDPRVITLKSLIEQGITIDPSSVSNMFNISDVADIEAHNDIQNESVYKFLVENQDKLKEQIKSSKS